MDGYQIATLVVFFLSITFVIHPVTVHVRSLRLPIDLTTAPILAIAILWAAQCIDGSVVRNGIVGTAGIKPYNIIILFFSLAYMAITLDITGILEAAAYWVSRKGGSNGWKLYLYFYLLLTLVSILIGNDPVILSGTAFLAYYTKATALDPIPWMMAEFAAANTASMVLFVGNPTNVVICEGFGVNDAAFTAYMILPFLACNILCFLALAVQYRKDIPAKLDNVTTYKSPRDALTDPVGALVGSILLASALVICLVVSFIGVDVWKISLPFAVAKFLFDVAWDYYKITHRKMLDMESGSGAVTRSPTTEEASMESNVGAIVEGHEKERSANVPRAQSARPSDDRDRGAVAVTTVTQSTATSSKVSSAGMPMLPKAKTDPWNARIISHLTRRRSRAAMWLRDHSHTLYTALPRLPFALVPFAFSQFILVEALAYQNWVRIFAGWLSRATHAGEMHSTIWLVGVMGVVLCNIAGTNIGATILLTEIVNAAGFSPSSNRAAAIALALASNIGAVSFTFSASLAGLLWKGILDQKEIKDKRGNPLRQREFALKNCLPLATMTVVGLAVVSAEMAVLYH